MVGKLAPAHFSEKLGDADIGREDPPLTTQRGSGRPDLPRTDLSEMKMGGKPGYAID
jgi:hypothetical protein